MTPGKVLRVSANTFQVSTPNGILACTLAGRLKKKKLATLKLAAVGDEVEVSEDGVIQRVLPRRNKLSRHDVVNPNREQVIAANIDRILITQSLASPGFNPLQTNRCLVMALSSRIPFSILLNKVDLLDPSIAEELLEPYRRLKYPILFLSAESGQGLDELRRLLQGKVSVFMGPSGVGKTSLINALSPGLNLKTKEVSWKTGEGTHTTSWAEIVDVGGAQVIDTPGMEFFTLWGVDEANLSEYFEEFRKQACRFPDCRHVHEPDCGVQKAVERGKVSPTRLESYLRILDELRSRKKIYRREGRRRVRDPRSEEE
jgi:ribosome biogenesis GTPase